MKMERALFPVVTTKLYASGHTYWSHFCRPRQLCIYNMNRLEHNYSTNRPYIPLCYSNRLSTSEHNFKSSVPCRYYCFQKTNLRNHVLKIGHNFCRNISTETSADFSVENPKIQEYLSDILEKYIKAQTKFVGRTVKTEAERKELHVLLTSLKPLVSPLQEYYGKQQEIEDIKQMANELGRDDKEIQEAATKEIEQIEDEMQVLTGEVQLKIVPAEPADSNDIILEVSAGVGGNEAFLFTQEVFDMYTNFAAYKGWDFMCIGVDQHESGHGGIRKASASVSGHDVYKWLKYEAGVHRVQRVPKTEKQGRVHTSTVTVVAMPQPTEIDIKIDPKDLKIDTFRSSGPGGQHVNTTDSAVRLKHIPTGTVAECQAERSQIRNKATAMKILLSRLYQQELDKQQKEQKQNRKMQVSSADRSDKIRTYNFKQDRITDHRLTENMFNLEQFLSGDELLDDMITNLQKEAWKERLLEMIKNFEDKKTEKEKS